MSYERTSSEILGELIPLFIEYQQVLERENKIKDSRISVLEKELIDLKNKNQAIAHILLND